METLAHSTGISEPALRLLVGMLAGYPLAAIWRLLPQSAIIKHLFSTVFGVWLAYFCFGNDFIHSFVTILFTYFALQIFHNRRISLLVVFVGIFGHLLYNYFLHATDEYDIDFTTTQSVMCLRLIGFAFDYYDGGKKETDLLGEDQKENRLKELPSLLELYGYAYFIGGFLVGPQYTFKRYKQFVTLEIFKDDKGNIVIPSSFWETFKSTILGTLYLAIHTVGSGYYPTKHMLNFSFSNESLIYRAFYLLISGKLVLMRYVGIWLLADGVCTLSGINFTGYKNGKYGWHALSNVNVWKYETALSLYGVVESFNINTNDWCKRYIFKRLRFLGNRQLSSIGTLAFLSVWHGFAAGYALAFFSEFLMMEAERLMREKTGHYWKTIEKNAFLFYPSIVIFYIERNLALMYGFEPMDFKKLEYGLRFYQSFYYLGHIIPFVLILVSNLLPKPPAKKE